MPLTVRMPPMKVVRRSPILSVRMPETGDRKNVVPMVSEPTRARVGVIEGKQVVVVSRIRMGNCRNWKRVEKSQFSDSCQELSFQFSISIFTSTYVM